jgi:hypothetical protein
MHGVASSSPDMVGCQWTKSNNRNTGFNIAISDVMKKEFNGRRYDSMAKQSAATCPSSLASDV